MSINILEQIEKKYRVKDVTANGEQVWPYLRSRYFFSHQEMLNSSNGERQSYENSSPLFRRLARLKTIFYGSGNWFRKYNYISLTDSIVRRKTEGQYRNIFLDQLIDELGSANSLMIEGMASSQHPANQEHTRNIVSSYAIQLGTWLMYKTMWTNPDIRGVSILKDILREYDFEIPFEKWVREFNAERNVFKLLFRSLRPKFVFLTCYYGREAAIKAAHDLGIIVVEVQHGVIGREHPAYNVHTELDKSCFPDYLLVYGNRELDTFDNSRFIDRSHIIPVGSFYIDYIKENYKPDKFLADYLSRFRKTVGVTLQLGIEKVLIEFVNRSARLDNSIGYVLIPRVLDNYVRGFQLPSNVTIIGNHNFYELMMHVDFHSTASSTCSIEAPSLGVQNILINIDNESKIYYGDILNDNAITRFVETPEAYVNEINTFAKLDRETICQSNKNNILPGYKQNILSFVRRVRDRDL